MIFDEQQAQRINAELEADEQTATAHAAQNDAAHDPVTAALLQILREHQREHFQVLLISAFSITDSHQSQCLLKGVNIEIINNDHELYHALQMLDEIKHNLMNNLAKKVIDSIFDRPLPKEEN